MNRFAFGLSLLVVAPLAGGCGLYITAPPEPEPTPKPAATPLPHPFDPTQGVGLATSPSDKGLPLNGTAPLPATFRAADVIFAPRSSRDTANFTPLLVLQSAGTDANGNTILNAADVRNPVRLAGVIVPAPNTPGYEEALQAARNWAQGQPVVIEAPGAPTTATSSLGASSSAATSVGTTASARPTSAATRTTRGTATISIVPSSSTARGTATAGRSTGAAATSVAAFVPSQGLDVYQDPQYPIDSEDRRLVQVFFKSGKATATVPAGTLLSLNRMLIRSGWAVVDLYSPTAFDQQSWLLDESYARSLKLGLWRYGVALQQRLPVFSTGTGSQSNVSVSVGSSPGTINPVPGAGRAGRGPVTAGEAPLIVRSGSSVARGQSTTTVLPPASSTAGAATSGTTGAGFGSSSGSSPGSFSGGGPSGSMGNSATGRG